VFSATIFKIIKYKGGYSKKAKENFMKVEKIDLFYSWIKRLT